MPCINHPLVVTGLDSCTRCAKTFCIDCLVGRKSGWFCAACDKEVAGSSPAPSAAGASEDKAVAPVLKGKGCKKQAKATVRKHKRRLSLTKNVKGLVLRPGAKLTVASSRPGYVTRVISFTMIARKNPRIVVQCLPPGAKKLQVC